MKRGGKLKQADIKGRNQFLLFCQEHVVDRLENVKIEHSVEMVYQETKFFKWFNEVASWGEQKGTEKNYCATTVHLQDPSWFFFYHYFFLTIFILKNQQKKHLLVIHFSIMVVNMWGKLHGEPIRINLLRRMLSCSPNGLCTLIFLSVLCIYS